jgi:ATP-dependent protease ClpP protease subunit
MAHRLIVGGELVLHGPIGFVIDGEGFLSIEIIEALAEMDGDIRVRINSPGGIAADGIAVYNALRAHDGRITTIIDGQALSAGAIVAMGGDDRLIGLGGAMMIHNASGVTAGPARAHAKSIEVLNVFDDSQAKIFARATGKSVAAMRKLLDEETWLTADEAIRQGFATGRVLTSAREPTAFDYRVYSHAPERLVAMAASKGWRNPTAGTPPAADPDKGLATAKYDHWLAAHTEDVERLIEANEAGPASWRAVFDEVWGKAQAGAAPSGFAKPAAETILDVAREFYRKRYAAQGSRSVFLLPQHLTRQ